MSDGWKSEIVKQFYNSPAWSKAYDLPIVPRTNNPWIYGAYCMKVMCSKITDREDFFQLARNWTDYAHACEVKPGLYNRKPDGSGGVTSHDEVIGIAYLTPFAYEILRVLEETDGVYCNVSSEWTERRNTIEKYNITRFYWLKPFLKSMAGLRVGIVSQLAWSLHIVLDAIFSDTGDAGGKLRNWIMFGQMSTHPICRLAIKFWAWQMKRKNVHLNSCLRVEPKEAQILYETAGKEWI